MATIIEILRKELAEAELKLAGETSIFKQVTLETQIDELKAAIKSEIAHASKKSLLASNPTFGMSASQKRAYEASKNAPQKAKSIKKDGYDFRVLYADSQHAPVKKGYVMTGRGKSFRISEDHPSYEGAHLLGYEGDLGSYAYYKKEVKKDKASVMRRAWVIAKKAQAKFGGKASQYLSGALKAAWAE